MCEDEYSGIANRYDLFHGEFGAHPPAVSAFFRTLFSRHGVEGVLDCACGTGRHVHLFHSLGLQVIGSDLSPSMLDQARRNLEEKRVDAQLLRVDYRDLPRYFHRTFGAVVCLASSILHMPDDEQVVAAFRSMRAVLRDGGVLVLTQGTSDKQWREKPRFILAASTSEFSRLFVIDYEGAGARYNVVDIFHGEGGHELKVWSVSYPHMLLGDDYERLLRRSGFARVDCYGTYEFDAYDTAESDLLIVVAQR